MQRREFVGLTSIGLGALAVGGRWIPPEGGPAPTGGLASRAAARGILYGSLIRIGVADKDPAYARLYADECGVVVPGTSLFWPKTRPTPETFDFSDSDRIYQFASAHGIKMRGHTLVWYKQLPDWFAGRVTAANAESVLRTHITTLVTHFKGKMHSWDVVNEVLDDKSSRPDGLGASAWLDFLGPDYIKIAFQAAHDADPQALLVYNENHMDYDTPQWDRKRELVLNLLHRLKSEGVPVGALGIQAHLNAAETHFTPGKYRGFLKDVASLGLKVVISELDARDNQIDGSLGTRDAAVASAYSEYLATALDEPAVTAVLTWGLSDKDTWLEKIHHRKDGQPLRPLPFDDQLQRKPAYEAVGRAFDAAPSR